jgi:hypothetical protein
MAREFDPIVDPERHAAVLGYRYAPSVAHV